jgi:hypothetical protein
VYDTLLSHFFLCLSPSLRVHCDLDKSYPCQSLVLVVLVELYFGLKVIGIETFIFDPKNIEGYSRRNREYMEHALRHAFKLVKGWNYEVFISGISSIKVWATT